MKKTRLLEIIREEISGALSEIPDVHKDSNLEIKKPSKYKHLAEKYQIDEETINEMASIAQTIKGLKALGDEKEAEEMSNIAQKTLKQYKKDPIINKGRLARNLDPDESPNKKKRTVGYSTEFLKNYEEETGKDFGSVTFDIEARYKTELPGEKLPFKSPGLAANTTDKNAANAILGKVPNKPGPKADPNKPKKEKTTGSGKRGRPAGAAKTATRTKDDDGFDKVEYSDSDSSGDNLSDLKDEVAKTTTNMKDLAKKFSKAEGEEKENLKNQLKDLTKKKKELEKELEKQL